MQLAEIQALYDQGLFLQASDALHEHCGHELPAELGSAVLAVRMANQLDCPRERLLLYRHLQKHWGESAPATRYRVYELADRGRFAEALELAFAHDRLPDAGDEEHADWLQARALVFARFRDLENASAWLERSREFTTDLAWIELNHAWNHWFGDEPEQALARAEALVTEHPDYPWVYSLLGSVHFELDHRDEALRYYAEGGRRFESPSLWYHHARVLRQIGRLHEARQLYEELASRRPWPKRSLGRFAYDELFRIAHELGEHDEAARLWDEASAALRKFYSGYEPGRTSRRVRHDVPYVRQDELTCAPATLSAVLRWFGVDVPHDEVAGQITYSGTPDHRLHAFCTERGLTVRPFQFEEDAARRLIDAGLPFCLGTRAPEMGHLQALVGYDEALGVWLVREPGVHHWIELPMARLREEAAARGAPCTLVAPPERLAALDGDPLPFERETALMNRVFAATDGHRLDDAREALRELEQGPAGPWLWDAQRSVGAYTNDIERELAASRAQHAAFPEDEYVRTVMIVSLLRAQRGDEVLEFAQECGGDFDRSPHVDLHLLDELARRRSQLERAMRLARRVCRRLPRSAEPYREHADLLWLGEGDRAAALLRYRAATTLNSFDERFAYAYFDCAHRLGHAGAALDWLRHRVTTKGEQHAAPRVTLARAYAQRHAYAEQVAELDRALQAPLGRDVAVHERIDLHVENDELDAALALLERHEHDISRASHVVRTAEILRLQGRVADALATITPAAEAAPSASYLQAERAACLDAAEGPAAVATMMRPLVERFPEHLGLSRILGQALLGLEDHGPLESFLAQRVRAQPGDATALQRYLALLARTGRGAELVALADDFEARYGHMAWYWFQRARGHLGAGELDAAKAAFARTLELDPLHEFAPSELLQLAESPDEAQAMLRRVAAGFARDRVDGASLQTFVRLAVDVLPPEEIEQVLAELAERFPELPEIPEQRAEFFARRSAGPEAIAAIAHARERFPQRRETTLLAIRILDTYGDSREALELAEQLVRQNPRDAGAAIQLGSLLESQGAALRARQVYETALRERPLSPVLHGCLADLELGSQDPENALPLLRRAIELDPFYTWARSIEIDLLMHLRRYDEAKERAERFALFAHDDEDAWQAKARVHERLGETEAAILALREALRCDPLLGDTRTELVYKLVHFGRHEEARAVVDEGKQALGPTRELRLLDAWILRRMPDTDAERPALRALLEEEPDFERGWHTYVTWLLEDEDDRELDRLAQDPPPALEKLPRFHEALARSYAARRRVRDADRAACRWVELAPAEDEARQFAAGCVRESGAPDAADQLLLEHPEPESAQPGLAALAFDAALRQGELELAARFLHRALTALGGSRATMRTLERAVRRVRARDWPALRAHLARSEDPRAHDGLLCVEAFRGQRTALRTRLGSVDLAEKDGEAASRMLRLLMLAGQDREVRAHLLPRLEAPIPGIEVWGVAGYVFLGWRGTKGARIVTRLLADWQRPDAEPWMLVNLAAAYQALGDAATCERISRAALALPLDHSEDYHKSLIAWARIAQGDWSEVEHWAADPGRAHPGPMLESLALRMLARIRAAEPGQRRRIFGADFARILRRARDLEVEGVGGTGLCPALYRFVARQLVRLGLPLTGLLLQGGPLLRGLVRLRVRAS